MARVFTKHIKVEWNINGITKKKFRVTYLSHPTRHNNINYYSFKIVHRLAQIPQIIPHNQQALTKFGRCAQVY